MVIYFIGRTVIILLVLTVGTMLLSNYASVLAQSLTVSGYVTDSESGEALIGTNVYEINLRVGTTTNNYGFFSLTLPVMPAVIRFSYQGYAPETITFQESPNDVLQIELDPTLLTLDSLEITASYDRLQDQVQMSKLQVTMEDVQTLPALLGEPDILKTFQLMPGVSSGAEGSSGLYVRGGTPDQTLILLDGATVYNAGHLFGFLSTFNSEAINSATLLKGGLPARYGGRLAAVLDMTMREGNRKSFNGKANVGILASQLTVEGPIQKEKSSYLFAARRTYFDLITLGINQIFGGGGLVQGYFFHDLNAKANFDVSKRDRLFISAYIGEDKGYERTKNPDQGYRFQIGWRNIASTLRWSHVVNSRMFANTMLIFSTFRSQIFDQQYYTDDTSTIRSSRYSSGIQDFAVKTDIEYQAHLDHYVRFGGVITRHLFIPSRQNHRQLNDAFGVDTTTTRSLRTPSMEWSTYIEDEFTVTDWLKTNGGVHVAGYLVDGVHYSSVQPRISTSFLLWRSWALKTSYMQTQQFIQQLSNSGAGLPTDLWLPSTPRIRPQKAWQAAIGVARTIESQSLDVSIESYYRESNGLIAYKEGSNFVGSSTDWEETVTSGRGWAYGVEFLVHRKRGSLTGWIGYTLSWSQRRIAELNRGEVFPHKYDRRHDFSVAMMYQFGRTKVSATWVYTSGRSVTLNPTRYRDRGVIVDVYTSRNNYRIPAYHKLDLTVHFPRRKFRSSELSFGLYNAYNRQNIFFLIARETRDLDTKTGFENEKRTYRQVTYFPILPSISYKFQF